jgi:predicted GIY-YIG superfamily endonuclease
VKEVLDVPRKDKAERLKYQREWYARNSALTIAKVARRKHTLYAGICQNCGDPTVGQSKGKAPRYCHKVACIKMLWKEKNGNRSK